MAAIVVVLVVLATVVPVAPVRAEPAAPVLVGPIGTTAPDVVVDFQWERVPGATLYNLRVWHESDDGEVLKLDEWTVNDRFIGVVNFQGDDAHWSVRAHGWDNSAGPAAEATFTTARIPATLVWPEDGATLVHPDIAATPIWRGASGQHEGLYADNSVGSSEPLAAGAPVVWAPGAWRWGIQAGEGSHVPYQPAPPSAVRSFTLTWPGATPTLQAPAAGASIAAGSAIRLTWAEAPGAALYQWEVVRGADGTTVAGSQGKAPWGDVHPFLIPGAYTWRVRAVMSGTLAPLDAVWGPWTAPRAFTVTAPAAPTLSGPADGAALTSWPTLRWNPVAGAGHYLVQVAASEDPDAPVGVPATPVAAFAFRTPASGADMYAASEGGGTRFWRVRAEMANSGSPLGGWSEWRSFTVTPAAGTLPAPVEATMLGPDDCTSDACPDLGGIPYLRWNAVAKAARYRVFMRWDGGSGPPDSWFDVASSAAPLPQLHQAQPGARTAWAVVACPADECTEQMPATRRHFRVGYAAPVQAGPADGTAQQAPSIGMAWTAPPAPDEAQALAARIGYDVQWHRTPGAYGDPFDNYNDGADGTLFTVDTVRNLTEVEWRVRVSLPFTFGDGKGAWSPWWTVERDEAPLTLVTPTEGAIVDATPRLDWTPATYAASGYAVHVVNVEAPWWTVWGMNTGATSVEVPPLPPGTYAWRVFRTAAMYVQGDGDGPEAEGTFTVEGDTRLHTVAPAGGTSVRADDVVLEWEPTTPATEYSVMVGTTPDVTWDTAVYSGWSPSTVHAVSKLLPEGDLYWRVCARSECSDAAGFAAGTSAPELMRVTAAPGPDVTDPVAVGKAVTTRGGTALATNGSIPATISWTASDAGGSGISAQAVQLKRGTGSWQSIPVSVAARSASILLLPGSDYSHRIKVTDGAGNVGYSATGAVSTTLRQETSTTWRWSSGWTRTRSSGAWGGYTRYGSRRGASVSMSFSGRSIALVSPRSSGRGSANVYLDGALVATVRLYASPTGARRIVFTKSWATSGSHRITIKLLGTAGHPRFDVDAFAILR